jgi:hypothetical protein
MGRKKYPEGMRAVNTSLRLRPDRLAMFKLLGTKWLNAKLDREIKKEMKLNASTSPL